MDTQDSHDNNTDTLKDLRNFITNYKTVKDNGFGIEIQVNNDFS